MPENLPPGTTELHNLLGVHPGDDHGTHHEHEIRVPHDDILVKHGEGRNPEAPSEILHHDADTNTYTVNISEMRWGKMLKSAAPYITVFVVVIIAYVLLFTNFSFGSFVKSITSKPDVKQNSVSAQSIPSEELASYNAWIRSYFFDVSDPKILDPNSDISGNGLTNYQKFLLGLNPKKKDTLGLGRTDTESLLMGIDPLTGNPLSEAQKKAIAEAIDLETLSNKISIAAAASAPKVAGATTDVSNGITIDTNKNGKVEIPALKISVPLIFSKSDATVMTDLQNGVIHFPQTVLPGQIGTSYISGHSSNYAWAKGSYNRVFDKLGNLKKYDTVIVTATDTNGKEVRFHFVVMASEIFKPDDQRQFASIGKPTIALSTCWPIGTNQKRLVVFAHLSQIER